MKVQKTEAAHTIKSSSGSAGSQKHFEPTIKLPITAQRPVFPKIPEPEKALEAHHSTVEPQKTSGKRKWIAVYGFVLIVIIAVVTLLSQQSTNSGPLQNQQTEDKMDAKAPDVQPAVNTSQKPISEKDKETIDNLLVKAKKSLDDNRLTTPPDHCAFFYYNAVRKIDPENQAARQGYYDIGTQYAVLAEQALNNFKYGRAKYYVDTGLGVAPNHTRLLSLRKEVYAPHPKRVIRGIKNIFK